MDWKRIQRENRKGRECFRLLAEGTFHRNSEYRFFELLSGKKLRKEIKFVFNLDGPSVEKLDNAMRELSDTLKRVGGDFRGFVLSAEKSFSMLTPLTEDSE